MRIRLRASRSSFIDTTTACLFESRRQASNSCSTRDSAGQSCAETMAAVAERLSRPSVTRAASYTSRLVESRTVPSASRTRDAQPSTVR